VPREQGAEALLMGLRLREGVDLAGLAQRLSLPAADLIDRGRLALHEKLGLAWSEGERIGVTAQGMPVLDALLSELVPDALAAA
jgi:coproporphyrinogen III oxidase-like Fe-S oxidoreductase